MTMARLPLLRNHDVISLFKRFALRPTHQTWRSFHSAPRFQTILAHDSPRADASERAVIILKWLKTRLYLRVPVTLRICFHLGVGFFFCTSRDFRILLRSRESARGERHTGVYINVVLPKKKCIKIKHYCVQ